VLVGAYDVIEELAVRLDLMPVSALPDRPATMPPPARARRLTPWVPRAHPAGAKPEAPRPSSDPSSDGYLATTIAIAASIHDHSPSPASAPDPTPASAPDSGGGFDGGGGDSGGGGASGSTE